MVLHRPVECTALIGHKRFTPSLRETMADPSVQLNAVTSVEVVHHRQSDSNRRILIEVLGPANPPEVNMRKSFFFYSLVSLLVLSSVSASPIRADSASANLDVMQQLLGNFAKAVADQNQDLSYYQNQLDEMNSIANALADNLQGLSGSDLNILIEEAPAPLGAFLECLTSEKCSNNVFSVPPGSLTFDEVKWINNDIQNGNFSDIQNVTSTPEPGILTMLSLGLGLLIVIGWRLRVS